MSTKEDLKNIKPQIRKIYDGRCLSVSIPRSHSRKVNLKSGDYVYSYIDERNRIIYEKVKTESE